MNTKHSKGNWRISSDGFEITTSKVGILEGSKKICEISSFDKEKEEIEANAKLIAAAPLLLEELQKMVTVFEPFAKEAQYVSGLFSVKQLIKKATE